MIRLEAPELSSVDDAHAALQNAIEIELGTLPPYLYALYTLRREANPAAAQLIHSVAMQEMIHFCLDCNILNALGGDPVVKPPEYPGRLPGDIGPPDGEPLTLHIYPFSEPAMAQAMAIEEPADAPSYPVRDLAAAGAGPVTIGEYYRRLDGFLGTLPSSAWSSGRHQIDDDQFFAGLLFPVDGYADAHRAIDVIVSEGEGTPNDPLDFLHELAHYYRFGEIYHDRVLTKTSEAPGYAYGPARLGVDWSPTGAYPAIDDPQKHDFSQDPPAARAAQAACDQAYTALVDHLQQAVTGTAGALGQAVRAMCDLAQAATYAVTVPLADPGKVAGPAFRYGGQTP